MKTKTVLYRAIMGSLLILSLIACQDKLPQEIDENTLQSTLQFFTRAESDRISREGPPHFNLFVGSVAADIESLTGFPVIRLTEEGLKERYPEQITGYGDIGLFALHEWIYDPTRHIVTSVYSSCEWSPFAGSVVCSYKERPRTFEQDWLTEIDYLCERCVQIFIEQMNLQDAATQVNPLQIGASAAIQSVPVGKLTGELVLGHWSQIEKQTITQTLQWTEDGKYATLRWRQCNWLFEIRAKGQDGGFIFEDLIPIAQDVHNQVVCQE